MILQNFPNIRVANRQVMRKGVTRVPFQQWCSSPTPPHLLSSGMKPLLGDYSTNPHSSEFVKESRKIVEGAPQSAHYDIEEIGRVRKLWAIS